MATTNGVSITPAPLTPEYGDSGPRALAAPAAPAAPPPDKDEEISRLKQLLAERDGELESKRIADAMKPGPKSTINRGAIAVARQRLKTTLGNAGYFATPPAKRMQLLGLSPATPEEVVECQKYHGPKSNSLAASQLSKTDPTRYARLGVVFDEYRDTL